MYLYYLLLLLLGLLIFHIVTRYGHAGRLLSNIPAAYPTLPIIGSLLIFIKPDAVSSWNLYRNLYKKYYPIVKVWSLTYPTVLIWDPDDVKMMLTSKENINKAYPYEHLHFVAGTGLLTGGGKKWTQRRKLLNPAFHNEVLKRYLEVTDSHLREFLKNMSDHDDVSEQNISSILSKLILTIMTETSMGVDKEFFETRSEYYENLVKRVFDIVVYRNVRPFISNWIYQFTSVGRRQKILDKESFDFTTKLIDDRRKYHESTGYKFIEIENDSESSGGRKKFAILDLLLSLERKGLIDKSGIYEEIITFTVAAHDTSTSALVFTLLLLAENVQSQTLARKEAFEVLSRCNSTLTVDSIKELEYIDRCLKEAMRIYSPAPMYGRSITKDLQLKNHVIPAGTDLMALVFDIHRNPRYWTDPLKFDPNRFLPERIKNQYPYTYIPFSLGLRNCIGQKLATLILKALIAHILHNYKLEPITNSNEIKFKLSIVLTPLEPIYIRFIKLNKDCK